MSSKTGIRRKLELKRDEVANTRIRNQSDQGLISMSEHIHWLRECNEDQEEKGNQPEKGFHEWLRPQNICWAKTKP